MFLLVSTFASKYTVHDWPLSVQGTAKTHLVLHRLGFWGPEVASGWHWQVEATDAEVHTAVWCQGTFSIRLEIVNMYVPWPFLGEVVPEDEVGDVAGGCEDSVGEQPEVKGEQELGGELGEELVPGLLHKFCIKYIAFLQVYM